jgi:glycosyltransferase involved in cell wall biosynthesis
MHHSSKTLQISVIIPTFNEGEIIASVVRQVREILDTFGQSYEVLVIDDGSSDETAAQARSAGAVVYSHPYNIGNGAAVKSGIRKAQGEALILMDGDGQHDPADIPRLLEKLESFDMVVGARTSDSVATPQRKWANRLYNRFATYMCKHRIEDLTSGFRAIKTDIARQFVSLLPNEFSYPTTITMALIRSGYSLIYIPIKANSRIGKSKIKPLRDGSRFFMIIIKIATLFSPMRVFLPVSAAMFLVGLGYGLFRILFMGGRYGPTSAMLITMSIVVFMVGLVSEQIAQLRFDRSKNRD